MASEQMDLRIAKILATKPAWWGDRGFPRTRLERRAFLALERRARRAARRKGGER